MPGIDPTIALGIKVPDQTTQLSSLLNAASAAQTVQNNGISLNERQAVGQFLSNPSNYTDASGNVDGTRLMQGVMKVAPTTGAKHVQDMLTAQKQHTEALSALNTLDDQDRTRVANVLSTIPPGAPADVVNGTFDALGKQYRGRIDPTINLYKQGYAAASKAGPQAVGQFLQSATRGVLPQTTQQQMDTPDGQQVDNGQQVIGINQKPGVKGYAQGAPMFSVQKKLAPNTPTVGDNNQPGYIGPEGPTDNSPAAYDREISQAQASLANVKDPTSQKLLQDHIANMQRLRGVAAAGPNGQPAGRPGFVPAGPVPGANESKGSSVAVMNDHWSNLNKQAENSQMLEGLLGNIKSLAPGAITGAESGRRAYLNGLINSLHLGGQATGDMQKDTDLLEKNIAQLGLNTPASTDAMRTIVEAARPHSTMSKGAIEEAAAQLTGQIQANRAVRNALTLPKQMADHSGDPSVYQATKAHMEEVADPRAWQFAALSAEGKQHMLAKLAPDDRTALRNKIKALEDMGLLKK